MANNMTENRKNDRFRIEKRDLDFPFYNDESFGRKEMIILIIGVIIFSLWTAISSSTTLSAIIRSIIYFLLPLIPFLLVSGGKISPVVRSLHLYDIVLMAVFTVLLFVGSMAAAVGLINTGLVDPTTISPNPVVGREHDLLFLIGLFLQLFGEEMFKIDLFLVVLTFIYRKYGKRKPGIICGSLITGLVFGALHYYAYGNLLHVLVVQGLVSTSLMMYLYVRTKNVLVSYGAHVLLDLFALLAG